LGGSVVDSTEVNARLHRTGDFVAEFGSRTLRPVEVVVLARYRDALSGRVLEIGCGAGRLLGYLVALGGEVHGIDVSQGMVDACHRRWPEANVRIGDVRDPAAWANGQCDVIFPSYNVLDVFDDTARRQVLAGLRELLGPDGLLIFSSHNLAHIESGGWSRRTSDRGARKLLSKLNRPPSSFVVAAARQPKRIRNRRRLQPLQRRERDYAIINDEAYDYGALHYYVRRDDEERQLAELGFELLECLDLEGRRVEPGQEGMGPELHYIARPV
jgi:SAM-dependent methyltransferase